MKTSLVQPVLQTPGGKPAQGATDLEVALFYVQTVQQDYRISKESAQDVEAIPLSGAIITAMAVRYKGFGIAQIDYMGKSSKRA